jgi:hypothetical protein
MYKESPALGESVGQEATEVERRVERTTSTSFSLHKFQPVTTRLRNRVRYCFAGRRRAFGMLRQVQRFIMWRLSEGVVLSDQDRHQVTFVLASLLASAPPSKRKFKAEPVWHSLDYLSLSLAIADVATDEVWLEPLGETETMTIIQDVLRYREAHPQHGPISGKTIGKLLKVHAVEREASQCWNILPVDQTKTERKAQQTRKKRERKRKERQGRHESRAEYLARAEKRRAFCEAQGISDKTFQRRYRIEHDGTITLRPPVAQ